MPTQGWARPPPPYNGPRVLGPHPQQHAYQAYTAPMDPSFNCQTSSYAPTDIASAMQTMTLNPPDPTWYMDTSTTSHMTSSTDNLSSYFHLSNCKSGIITGNGHLIPISGFSHTSLPSPNPPLSLKIFFMFPK